jgi:copper chaperone
MTTKYRIKGMTCGGCVRAVSNAIRTAAADARVDVDLPSGTVSVEGAIPEATVAKAVTAAGFEFVGRA